MGPDEGLEFQKERWRVRELEPFEEVGKGRGTGTRGVVLTGRNDKDVPIRSPYPSHVRTGGEGVEGEGKRRVG